MIEESGSAIEGLSDDLKGNEREANDVAKAIMRYDKAVESVNENSEDWIKTLKSGNLQDQAAIMDDLAEAYGNMMDIDGSQLSDSFLQSAENLELMQKAAAGSEEAYDALMLKMQEDIIAQCDLDTTKFDAAKAALDTELAALNFETLEIGANLNTDAALAAMTDLVNAAGMTAEQATAYLASMGVDAEVIEEPNVTTDTVEYQGSDSSLRPNYAVAKYPSFFGSTYRTMVTYDETDGILFAGDAFGCFGALNGGCIDKNINTDIYWNEMRRYYANIVGKFGNPVQKALQKLGGLKINTICSTHGPVWEEKIPQVIDMYDKMSRYEAEEGVVIAYGTMYGNTEELAETIAEELSRQGIKNIIMHNVSHTHHSYILADVFKYKGLIVGCTTYNMNLYPEMESLLSKIAAREVKNRVMGYFGSYTWASAAVKKIGEYTEKLKFEVVGNPVEMKQAMKQDNYAQAKELAKAMADRLKADRK